jgi:hypothetical protein
VASSSARCMASRSPLSSSWIWVRQLNPSARTSAPGAASRSRGSRARSAQASAHLAWLTWKPKLSARPQQPVSRCPAWAPAAASSFSSASQPSTACWCQCTWVSTGCRTAAGVYRGVCSVSSAPVIAVELRRPTEACQPFYVLAFAYDQHNWMTNVLLTVLSLQMHNKMIQFAGPPEHQIYSHALFAGAHSAMVR